VVGVGAELELFNVSVVGARNVIEEAFYSFIALQRYFLEDNDIRSVPSPP